MGLLKKKCVRISMDILCFKEIPQWPLPTKIYDLSTTASHVWSGPVAVTHIDVYPIYFY